MKKKILPIVSILILTVSVFYFSGCKDAVENALSLECFVCTHPTDSSLDQDNVCNAAGITTNTDALEAQDYTCTKK